MARYLDCADICRVPLRSDVVVLHDASCVEQMDKRLSRLARPRRLLGDAIIHNRI